MYPIELVFWLDVALGAEQKFIRGLHAIVTLAFLSIFSYSPEKVTGHLTVWKAINKIRLFIGMH